ncbi:MAG TPA: hypothetical protein VKW70_10925, partial [Terriglobia bacterium]|nr:hypothetical protein [Terriglobia bacterium]
VTGKTHKAPALRAGRKKDLETILLDIADDLRDERSEGSRYDAQNKLRKESPYFCFPNAVILRSPCSLRMTVLWVTAMRLFCATCYGNMTCPTNGQTQGPCPNYAFSASTNRITTSGFTYDAGGGVNAARPIALW